MWHIHIFCPASAGHGSGFVRKLRRCDSTVVKRSPLLALYYENMVCLFFGRGAWRKSLPFCGLYRDETKEALSSMKILLEPEREIDVDNELLVVIGLE